MTLPTTELDLDALQKLVPPWRVILHNDDVNTMDHVVRSLRKAVPRLTLEEAFQVMMTAHEHGQATVIECPKEQAEHYRDRLESFGLTATMEPA